MSNLIHLIYNSAAVRPMRTTELAGLLRTSRNNNAARGITGILLYVDGCFFQVLEGEEAAVEEVASKIANDDRHTRMTVIIKEPIPHRAFGQWTMGFAEMSTTEFENVKGINDFFSRGQVLTELESGRAKKLLVAFRAGRWRVGPAQPPGALGRTSSPKARRPVEKHRWPPDEPVARLRGVLFARPALEQQPRAWVPAAPR